MLWFLYVTHLYNLLYNPTKYYQYEGSVLVHDLEFENAPI